MLSRRAVLGALSAPALLGPLGCATQPVSEATFLSCGRNRSGEHAALALSSTGIARPILHLPERGHGFAVSPTEPLAIVFGRRPATFMQTINLDFLTGGDLIASTPGRHFYGHGCFSADGALLFASENAFQDAQGVIGVYDAKDRFRRIGEFPSGGVGPHELILMSDGATIAMANGGIETHPDFPRAKLNLTTMRSNLTYIDAKTGAIIDQFETPPDLQKLSLRHLTETADGSVWIGGQYEGAPEELPPLIARHRGAGPLEFVHHDQTTPALRNYVGSIASSRDGQQVAVSSPHGGVLQSWNAAAAQFDHQDMIADVCGVAPLADGFFASSGQGSIWPDRSQGSATPEWSWDNHLKALPPQA